MSKNVKIPGKVLAIQLGREETQLILVNGGQVLYSTVLPTPMGAVEDGMIQNPDAVRLMLKEALKDPSLKRVHKVIFSLCTSQVITEVVTTPDLPAAKLDRLIMANADMYFPLDVQDHKVSWQVIGPKENETGLKELTVQLWAIPEAVLNNYYTVANACGLSVVAIDYCGHSMATAVGATFANPAKAGKKTKKLSLNMELSFGKKKQEFYEEDEEDRDLSSRSTHTDIHILLEKDLMGMTCVQRDQVVFQRFIRCGVDPSYQLSELSMMVDYFRASDVGRGTSVVGILSGALAEDRQLAAELADVTGISLGLLDFPYDLKLVCPMGAVHTNLDFGIPGLNKPSKARKEMQTNLWQYSLILVGGVMLISSVFSLLTARLEWSADLSIRQSNMMALQVESKQYDGFADNYQSYVSAYKAYSNDWDSVFINLQRNNDNLVCVMEELESLLPANASVTDLMIQDTGMNVTFACETKEEAAYLMMSLRDMDYANMLAISSLSGGGGGPATSYGTGKTGEKAPVEGGSDISTEDFNRLKAALNQSMEPYTVGYYLGLGKDIENDYLQTLFEVYGAQPNNSYSKLEDVPATFEQKTNAFYTMCTSNPFAMRAAEDMLKDHYKNNGILTTYIPISEYKGPWQVHRSVSDLEKDLENTLDLIYYNEEYTLEELFPVVEQVIKDYPDAELWYIYYLEGEIAGENPRPYLDLNTMTADLADGAFNSHVDGMNTVLYSLLSSDTLAILEEINAEDPTDPSESDPSDPSESESTDPSESESTLPSLPVDPDDPFNTDPSESESTDPSESDPSESDPSESDPSESDPSESDPSESDPSESDPSESDPSESDPSESDPSESDPSESDPSESESTDPSESESTDPSESESTEPSESVDMDSVMEYVGAVMGNYMETGSTGLTEAEEAIIITVIDQKLGSNNPYKDMTLTEILDEQLTVYFTEGETGFEQLDEVIESYLEENPEKEEDLREDYELTIERAFKDYLGGKDWNFEKRKIVEYLTTGNSGDRDTNELLDELVSDGEVDEELTQLLIDYRMMGEEFTTNEHFKTMMANYEAGTGNEVLNTQLKVCEKEVSKEAGVYLKQYLANGSADPRYDATIKKFLEGQETTMDELFEEYIADGKVDAELTKLIYLYVYQNQQLQNAMYKDTGMLVMMNNYHSGGTGSSVLDERIKHCYATMLNDYIKQLAEAKANANRGSGQAKEEPDTRIYFTVVLQYLDEELRQADLKEKGLDSTAKLEDTVTGKLEVAE